MTSYFILTEIKDIFSKQLSGSIVTKTIDKSDKGRIQQKC